MSYILNIETSANNCSISISNNNDLIFFDEKEGFSHAEMLAPMVQKALEETKVTLEAIAISEGPGSYTGLRIGTSFAKGLCYALNIPLIGVNTLELIALTAKQTNPDRAYDQYCPMIDARRDEVYLQSFDQNLKALNTSTNTILEPASQISQETSSLPAGRQGTLIIGSGSIKAEEILEHKDQLHFLHNINPAAKHMPKLSSEKFSQQKFEDLAYFEPFYLKPFYTTQKKKVK